jgi:hypothetical protein
MLTPEQIIRNVDQAVRQFIEDALQDCQSPAEKHLIFNAVIDLAMNCNVAAPDALTLLTNAFQNPATTLLANIPGPKSTLDNLLVRHCMVYTVIAVISTELRSDSSEQAEIIKNRIATLINTADCDKQRLKQLIEQNYQLPQMRARFQFTQEQLAQQQWNQRISSCSLYLDLFLILGGACVLYNSYVSGDTSYAKDIAKWGGILLLFKMLEYPFHHNVPEVRRVVDLLNQITIIEAQGLPTLIAKLDRYYEDITAQVRNNCQRVHP